MKIELKYFGVLAEIAKRHTEVVDVSDSITSEALNSEISEKYGFKDLDYRLAVNHKLNSEENLKNGDEIAFLPPFAGG